MITKQQKIKQLKKEIKWLKESLEDCPKEAEKQHLKEKKIFEAILGDYLRKI